MKKLFDSFNKLNDQTRYGFLGLAVIVIILLDVVLLALPQLAAVSSINDQIAKTSGDTQQVVTSRVRISQLKKNLQQETDQLNLLEAKVRMVQEVPALLSTISSIANEYSVKIDQLVPEKSQQEVLKNAPSDGKYYALPIVIKARCGYHKFGYFLNKLENQNMFFIMKDFIIQNDGQDANMRSFSLTIKMILVDRT